MKKYISSLLSVIFVSTLITTNNTHANDLSDFGKGLAIVGSAAAAIGGIIWACGEESDTALITRAENVYQDSYAIKSISDRRSLYNNFSVLPEECVEAISLTILAHNSARGIAKEVEKKLSALNQVKRDLAVRVEHLRAKHSTEKRSTIDTMLLLKDNISNRIAAIEKNIQSFLYYHQDYLELFEYEQALHKRYADVFALLAYEQKNASTRHTLMRAIGNNGSNQKYPYSALLTTIKKDITTLATLLKKITRTYPQRERLAYWVKEQLEYIHSVITLSVELQKEYLQKERDELERKEREFEKKRLEKKRKKLEKKERELYRKRCC